MVQMPDNNKDAESQANLQQSQTNHESPNPKPKRWWWWIGTTLLLGVGGGLTYGWIFIHQKLAPLVSDNLSTLVKRPIEVGEVEGISLTGISFGESGLPATETENDYASVDGVKATFDPWQLIFKRTLKLQITLVNPQVYIEQDQDGAWVQIEFADTKKGPLEIDVQTIGLQNAEVTVLPRLDGELLNPITAQLDSGGANLLNDYQLIQFNGKGKVAQGKLDVSGEVRPEALDTDLKIKVSDIDVPEVVTELLDGKYKGQPLPVALEKGKVNANLDIAVRNAELSSIEGKASLNDLTTKLAEQPKLPAAETKAQLIFQGKEVRLDKFTTTVESLQVDATGTVNLDSGINLVAKTKPFTVEEAIKTAQLKQPLPVKVTGELQGAVQVTGTLQKPQITAVANSTKATTVDKVTFNRLQVGAKLLDNQIIVANLAATPQVGGQIASQGQILLNEAKQMVFNVGATNLPTTTLAKLYGTDLPLPVGNLSGQGKVFGSLNQPDKINVVGAGKVAVAGGTITAQNIQVTKDNWRGQVQARGIDLTKVPQIATQVPPGKVNGAFNLSGSLTSFEPETITASGAAEVDLAGGKVIAQNIQVSKGNWKGQVQARGIDLTKVPQIPSQVPPGKVNGAFNLSGSLTSFEPETITASGAAEVDLAGGKVRANQIQLNQGRWRSQVKASGIKLSQIEGLPPQLQQAGDVNAQINVAGSLDSFEPKTITANGNVLVNLAGGKVLANELQLSQGNWQGNILASEIQLGKLANLPLPLQGAVDGVFKVSGNLDNLEPKGITGQGAARVTLPRNGGKIVATRLQVANSLWQANVQTQRLKLAQLTPQIPAGLGSTFTGNFSANGSLDNLSPDAINGGGIGKLSLAGGEVDTNIKLNRGTWQALVTAKEIETKRFAPLLPSNTRQYTQQLGDANGTFRLSGNLNNLTPQGVSLTGEGNLAVAGGNVKASQVSLNQGEFQAVVIPENVALSPFSEQLRGDLGGEIQVNGNLANLNPTAIKATGKLNLNQGVSLVEGPLDAVFNWNGKRLNIDSVQAPDLNANGFVDVNLAKSGVDIVEQFNLDVDAQGLDLALLPLELPKIANDVNLTGTADFNGNLSGTVKNPNVEGDLALNKVAVTTPTKKQLELDPVLAGTVTFNPNQGSSINLTGEQDRFQLALDPNYFPTSLSVKLDQFSAQGKRRGDIFNLETENLPLAPIREIGLVVLQRLPDLSVNIPPQILAQNVAGNLNSNVKVNLNNFNSEGKLTITEPEFGTLKGEKITTQFRYQDSVAFVPEVTLQQGESKYSILDARFQQTGAGPKLQAQLKVKQGNIQKILAAAGIYSFDDIRRYMDDSIISGRAADLATTSVGGVNASIQQQLGHLAIIQALIARDEEAKKASPIPDLDKLAGKFDLSLDVANAPQTGFTVENINFLGKEWNWDKYATEKIILQGDFSGGILTVKPVRLQLAPESFISFSGSVGGETQSGQLKLNKIPFDLIEEVVKLPDNLAIDGTINASAALAGSKENPLTKGEIRMIDATINGEPIQSTRGSFSYNNARLDFSGRSILAADTDPVTLLGTIPYQLPFASVKPDSNQLGIEVDVKDKGLILLSLLSRGQVAWEEGKGDVNLAISGNFNQEKLRPENLIAKGKITLEDAIISSQFLPEEPLTNINGNILFNFDRIEVDNLEGKFSQGQINVAGNLPISQPQPQENPLTINLDQLDFKLQTLYAGGVDGQVQITGSALKPEIGGKIDLSNGLVTLPEAPATNSNGTATVSEEPSEYFSFNNFLIQLGKSIEIAKPPLLSIFARGDLNLNGTMANLQPNGRINLETGQVNLFATQLRLDTNYNNAAIFTPNQGTDPYLDLQLVTSVREINRQPMVTNSLSPEISINQTGLADSEKVVIQAKVSGSARKLTEVNQTSNGIIDLTSVPSRSETEIVSLLGGSFVNSFAEDATLGIASLASSALFSNLENSLRQNLGLSEFRVFPTRVPQGESDTPELTVGAEAGVDVTNQLSISVLKIFAEDRPAQYSVRYRLDDQTSVRGTTDLDGNNGVAVQYELRF